MPQPVNCFRSNLGLFTFRSVATGIPALQRLSLRMKLRVGSLRPLAVRKNQVRVLFLSSANDFLDLDLHQARLAQAMPEARTLLSPLIAKHFA